MVLLGIFAGLIGFFVFILNKPLASALLGAHFLGDMPWTGADSLKGAFVALMGMLGIGAGALLFGIGILLLLRKS